MRPPTQRWLTWRVNLTPTNPLQELTPPAIRLRATMSHTFVPLDDPRHDQPDADGVRVRFVELIRQQIEAGEYDTPYRLAIAEEMMLRQVEDSE